MDSNHNQSEVSIGARPSGFLYAGMGIVRGVYRWQPLWFSVCRGQYCPRYISVSGPLVFCMQGLVQPKVSIGATPSCSLYAGVSLVRGIYRCQSLLFSVCQGQYSPRYLSVPIPLIFCMPGLVQPEVSIGARPSGFLYAGVSIARGIYRCQSLQFSVCRGQYSPRYLSVPAPLVFCMSGLVQSEVSIGASPSSFLYAGVSIVRGIYRCQPLWFSVCRALQCWLRPGKDGQQPK